MNNVKKVVAMVMAGFVMLTFAGCGMKKESGAKKEKTKVAGASVDEGTDSGAAFDMSGVNVGDTVTIGKYEWIVLEKDGDAAYVITKDIVEFSSYTPNADSNDMEKVNEPVSWETSAVRAFLNEDFIYSCFSEEEQSMILETKVVTADNPKYGTDGGKDTKDKLFILEYDEVVKYFPSDEARKAVAPANPEYSMYFLRTPGSEANKVMSVGVDGSFNQGEKGNLVYYRSGIRPVMWIRIG